MFIIDAEKLNNGSVRHSKFNIMGPGEGGRGSHEHSLCHLCAL